MKAHKKFECDICNYNTDSKKDFSKHLTTDKHKKMSKSQKESDIFNQSEINSSDNKPIKKYNCNCGKSYNHRQNLCVHRKNCNFKNIQDDSNIFEKINDTNYKEIILKLILQNNILQNIVVEQQEKLNNKNKLLNDEN
jgi:hypothetical protein